MFEPSMSGSGMFAYIIQRRKQGNENWQNVEFNELQHEVASLGVPGPLFYCNVYKVIGVLGYEQAMALAWKIKAEAAAGIFGSTTKVRLLKYRITYDIKSEYMEGETILIGDIDTEKESEDGNEK